ncbi:MAG: hypothetical protein L3J83_03000 [Proteobacteria bacterium]|nr:hypothetical protein [Pseudomonadota bacterium]
MKKEKLNNYTNRKIASCFYLSANELSCGRINSTTGSPTDGPIMVLIY